MGRYPGRGKPRAAHPEPQKMAGGFPQCRWCGGNGCMCCDAERAKWEAERDAEYARQFPDGPTPIFAARTGNAKDQELLKRVFHADRLQEAFGPDGRGMAQIEEEAAKARAEQEPPYEYKPIGKGIHS
jgi:hypothetical protein